MYELDKRQFGAFVASLRKEKGFTQKELARKLFLSDKAVSKWETGVSIPDTAVLIPLADFLGVTVTELLLCRRIEPSKPMSADAVERVVKTAVSYPEEKPLRAYQIRGKWKLVYAISLAVSVVELLWSVLNGFLTTGLLLMAGFGILFGGYFCFFALEKLPRYYDENRISTYHDLFFQMSFPGVAFHNRNWPHILNAARAWSVAAMILYPILNYGLVLLLPNHWIAELAAIFLFLFGGMFLPIYAAGKKYE